MSGQMGAVALSVLVSLCIFWRQDSQLLAAPKEPVLMTPTLAAWISSQSENVVEEMEAIVRRQIASKQFSVVLYLRYLSLFNSLKVVASKENVPKFDWIAKKVRAFGHVYENAYNIVTIYVKDLDAAMTKIELNEKKGKQNPVSKEWVNIYQTINYIKTHAPRGSDLAKLAADMLLKSPSGALDKQRSTRFLLARKAFN